jgi:hypothetical protein
MVEVGQIFLARELVEVLFA